MHRALKEAIRNINIDARHAITQCDLDAFNKAYDRMSKMIDADILIESAKDARIP